MSPLRGPGDEVCIFCILTLRIFAFLSLLFQFWIALVHWYRLHCVSTAGSGGKRSCGRSPVISENQSRGCTVALCSTGCGCQSANGAPHNTLCRRSYVREPIQRMRSVAVHCDFAGLKSCVFFKAPISRMHERCAVLECTLLCYSFSVCEVTFQRANLDDVYLCWIAMLHLLKTF